MQQRGSVLLVLAFAMLAILVISASGAVQKRAYKKSVPDMKNVKVAESLFKRHTGSYDKENIKVLSGKEAKQRIHEERAAMGQMTASHQESLPKAKVDLIKGMTRTRAKVENSMALRDIHAAEMQVNNQTKKNFQVSGKTPFPFNSAPLLDVDDRFVFPYSALGIVVAGCQFDDFYAVNAICTGTVIGPGLVLTSDFCLEGDSITFYPSMRFESDALYEEFFSGLSYGAWPAATAYFDSRTNSSVNDFAVLVFDAQQAEDVPYESFTLGSLTGYLGVAEHKLSEMLTIMGYSDDLRLFDYSFLPLIWTSTAYLNDIWDDDGNVYGIYPTDIDFWFGSPLVANLGTFEPDFNDAGYDAGSFPNRNVIVGINSGADVDPNGDFGFVPHYPLDFFFHAALEQACMDNCAACPDPDACLTNDAVLNQGEAAANAPSTDSWNTDTDFEWNKRAPESKRVSTLSRPPVAAPQTKKSKKNGKSGKSNKSASSASQAKRFNVKVGRDMAQAMKATEHVKSERNFFSSEDGEFSSSPIIVSTNRFLYPYTALGKVFTFNSSDELVASCTGAVVGPSMLTADVACLQPNSADTFTWEFYPAWQQVALDDDVLTGTSLGVYTGVAVYVQDDYESVPGEWANRAGVLVLDQETNPQLNWRTFVVGAVTGWFGLDRAVDIEANLITQVAYSESHFPGRLQVVSTSLGSDTGFVLDADSNDVDVLGYHTDIFDTVGVPSIVNFGADYLYYAEFENDFGNKRGEFPASTGSPGFYYDSNILVGLAGIPLSGLSNYTDDSSLTPGQTYMQPFDHWFYELLADACSDYCHACDGITFSNNGDESDSQPPEADFLEEAINVNQCVHTVFGEVCCTFFEDAPPSCCLDGIGCEVLGN